MRIILRNIFIAISLITSLASISFFILYVISGNQNRYDVAGMLFVIGLLTWFIAIVLNNKKPDS